MVLITHGHFRGNFSQPYIFLYCQFWVIRPWPRQSGNPGEKTCVRYGTAQLQLGSGDACVCRDKMAEQCVVGDVQIASAWIQPGVRYPTLPLHPWQSPDCILIVGSAKSLVLNDKRFNHTKVWCTFIFIDLQARYSKLKCKMKRCNCRLLMPWFIP
jgi:hypothetical protein